MSCTSYPAMSRKLPGRVDDDRELVFAPLPRERASAAVSFLDAGYDSVMFQKPAHPSRRPTCLDFCAEPILVVDLTREQVQRELIGPPACCRRQPIQFGVELGRYLQVHKSA